MQLGTRQWQWSGLDSLDRPIDRPIESDLALAAVDSLTIDKYWHGRHVLALW